MGVHLPNPEKRPHEKPAEKNFYLFLEATQKMKMTFLPVVALLAALVIAGCAQDNTSSVNVYVNDDSGRPVDGAYVSAYSSYSLGTGANDKWTGINGTITTTGTTKNGSVTLQIPPGNYAFKATKGGLTGGEEKTIITANNYVNLTSPLLAA